jgi:hypothetical protein
LLAGVDLIGETRRLSIGRRFQSDHASRVLPHFDHTHSWVDWTIKCLRGPSNKKGPGDFRSGAQVGARPFGPPGGRIKGAFPAERPSPNGSPTGGANRIRNRNRNRANRSPDPTGDANRNRKPTDDNRSPNPTDDASPSRQPSMPAQYSKAAVGLSSEGAESVNAGEGVAANAIRAAAATVPAR